MWGYMYVGTSLDFSCCERLKWYKDNLYEINVSSLLTRRAALEKWKQKLGSSATYSNLIGVFECDAKVVRNDCGK